MARRLHTCAYIMKLESLLAVLRYSVPAIAALGLATMLIIGCGVESSDDVGLSEGASTDGQYYYYGH